MLGTISTTTIAAPRSSRKERDGGVVGVLSLHPCCSGGGCPLDTTPYPTLAIDSLGLPALPAPHTHGAVAPPAATTSLLLNSASAARWRRREGSGTNHGAVRSTTDSETRPSKELVLKVAAMEEVHGVDVSWLHHPNKGTQLHRKPSPTSRPAKGNAEAPPSDKNEVASVDAVRSRKPGPVVNLSKLPSPPNVTPPTPVEPAKDTTTALPNLPTNSPNTKATPKRPGLLSRVSAEKLAGDGKSGSRRTSWMTSISSKFSSQQTPDRVGSSPLQPPKQQAQSPGTPPATNGLSRSPEAVEEVEPYTPLKPNSFFSSLTRRLSSNSQTSVGVKAQNSGGVGQRVVLNVDPNRERVLLPEMDPNRLRRVSFCVDVEIAGGSRFRDDDDDEDKTRRKKEFKMKERAEGEALKHPEATKEEKDDAGESKLENKSKALPILGKQPSDTGPDENSDPKNSPDDDAAARKREKKKRSEEERKERKEKRRKRAEENGQIPVELALDREDRDATAGSSPSSTAPAPTRAPPAAPHGPPQRQDRPTTDPVRIYRRCCQLRESPILKRITEQLMAPKCCLPSEPGIVTCLDLTGSRLQLADVVSLGDWLAVVPVKILRLEDADLNDEGVRCILAGLLAAKRPEPTRRRSTTPKHREGIPFRPHQERAGMIERITFKNNPRISRVGWKHISLFLYMCRSLKAIDVSMNQFPETLPPSAQVTPVKSSHNVPYGKGQEVDAAEALFQCLSERPGGGRLEELIMSECGLDSAQVRKVVDGAVMSGVSRIGLAGNHLDDEGLEHVLRYLRSGICRALDIGGNDLRGKLDLLADAMASKNDLPCWGLSLAGCNLDSASLKPLFAALVTLPDFRFIDLSHNRDLCGDGSSLVSLLRRYIGQMTNLKRIHLGDVGMSPKQAIALADVLAEGPRLAHLSLTGNPQLTALANAKNEEGQEEACALYASLMAAVRVSSTLICVDIDVPSSDNSEVVKALAKQVVAYSLRNMEQFAIAEATGGAIATANATAALTGPHGGESSVKGITVPDVLMHLVGHVEGEAPDELAPDDDYIVGGTGVVKALQYVLGEKSNDLKRNSVTGSPISGAMTPRERPDSSPGLVAHHQGKAKKMSSELLGSARKIRARLQPALVKEATCGDELAYRRLLFLDQTLQSMIQRFEEEYPDTRIAPPSPKAQVSEASSLTDQSNVLASSVNTQGTEPTNLTDEEDFADPDDDAAVRPRPSRRSSDVSIASRALGLEEGRLHRIGQQMRREVIDSPASGIAADSSQPPWEQDDNDISTGVKAKDEEWLRAFGERIESISGAELKQMVDTEGWEGILRKLGGHYDDLRHLQEQDPQGWEAFKESQMVARMNVNT